MALYCKKNTCIIKRNNVKTPRWFLLSELPSLFTSKKHDSHRRVCEKNKDFCNIVMASGDNKILEFNLYHKSDKAQFLIYADPLRLTLSQPQDIQLDLKRFN